MRTVSQLGSITHAALRAKTPGITETRIASWPTDTEILQEPRSEVAEDWRYAHTGRRETSGSRGVKIRTLSYEKSGMARVLFQGT